MKSDIISTTCVVHFIISTTHVVHLISSTTCVVGLLISTTCVVDCPRTLIFLLLRVTSVMFLELKPGLVYCITQLLTAETHDDHTIPLLSIFIQFRAQAVAAL